MTHFGKIKSYDNGKGTGTISPEKGGDALPFRKSDLQQEAQVPKQDERYGYEVKDANNGKRYAINLAAQQGEPAAQKDQANAQQG
ncbi:cold-shock protein [Altererythrobacter sp. MF3-039]|uniref:cold-shock protein n=1 Tax=Altererythrobacter sp. MF3-039 TaxID=3252901 RepID=UPI00390CBD2A